MFFSFYINFSPINDLVLCWHFIKYKPVISEEWLYKTTYQFLCSRRTNSKSIFLSPQKIRNIQVCPCTKISKCLVNKVSTCLLTFTCSLSRDFCHLVYWSAPFPFWHKNFIKNPAFSTLEFAVKQKYQGRYISIFFLSTWRDIGCAWFCWFWKMFCSNEEIDMLFCIPSYSPEITG